MRLARANETIDSLEAILFDMEKDRNLYYHSSSFPLLTYLRSRDQHIAWVQPTAEKGQKSFSFYNNPELEELVRLYKFGSKDDERLLVNVHKYEQARLELLSLLKD